MILFHWTLRAFDKLRRTENNSEDEMQIVTQFSVEKCVLAFENEKLSSVVSIAERNL